MKIDNNKITEITDSELFDLYLKREMDDIMSFNEYKMNIKNTGCIIVE